MNNRWEVTCSIALFIGLFCGSNDNNHGTRVVEAFFPIHPSCTYGSSCGSKHVKSITTEPYDVVVDTEQQKQRRRTTSTVLFVGGTGWDNENFLESLSKGSDAINKANEEYRQQSRFANMRPASADDDDDDADTDAKAGMVGSNMLGSGGGNTNDEIDGVKDVVLSKDQIERIKKQNEEESGGGEALKRLLERAQQGSTLKEIIAPPPPPPPPTTTSSQQSAPVLPEGFEKLSVEAQAALFRQLMSSPPPVTEQPIPQWPPAPGPRPEAKGQAMLAPDGRKIGRNRDADALVNTADVYFAQLKLDSAARNKARMQGDDDSANAVFSDPKIPEIKLHINPYMEEQRKKELAMIETAADEMFTPEILSEYKKEVDVRSRGISYKEMLEQKRKAAQKQQPNSGTGTSPPPVIQATTTSPPVQNAIQSPPPPPPVPSIPRETVAEVTRASKALKTDDETRRDIRTLMGLLIKHRGGPGFGAGRIAGAEMERFAALTKEIIGMLRGETSHMPTSNPSSVQRLPNQVQLSTPSQPLATMPAGSASIGAAASPSGDRINGALTCIDGAITMYRNAPPELQPSVLVTLRAALLSAINTCNDILASTNGAITPPTVTSSVDRIDSVLACIDGAITMYRNAPPEIQASVLVTLRAALLSAVCTCNEIVADAETEPFAARTTDNNAPGLYSTPNQFYDVTPAEAGPISLSSSTASFMPASQSIPDMEQFRPERSDENAAFLESVYQKLKNAAGDGKMGLRQDLDAAAAEELASDISRMRALLVEELNGSNFQPDSSSQPPAAVQYKQMLAKVRADKDAAGTN